MVVMLIASALFTARITIFELTEVDCPIRQSPARSSPRTCRSNTSLKPKSLPMQQVSAELSVDGAEPQAARGR